MSWVQVWVGTPDLQQLHLQWHELATSATCQGLACTLPLAASFAPGEYVVYIQPWGPDGFIVNDFEGWLGPVYILNQGFTQPLPTPTPLPYANIPLQSEQNANDDPAVFFEVTNVQELEAAINDPAYRKVILLQPGAPYQLTQTLIIQGEVYIVGNSTVSPVASTSPSATINAADTVLIQRGTWGDPGNDALFSIFGSQTDVTFYNLVLEDSAYTTENNSLVRVSTQGTRLSINEVRIDGGDAVRGGAISLNTSTLTSYKSLFVNNHADQEGGAIHSIYGGNAQIDCTHFEANTIPSNSPALGGAISNTNSEFSTSLATVTNSNFVANGDGSSTAPRKTLHNVSFNDPSDFTLDNVYIDDDTTNILLTNELAQPFDISTCEVQNFLPPIACPSNTTGLPTMITDRCFSPEQAIIDELATYGVITWAGGLPDEQQYSGGNWTLQNGQTWTLEELQEVLLGVQTTAEALYRVKYGSISGTMGQSDQARDIFFTVMSEPNPEQPNSPIFLLRVNNDFTFTSAHPCDLASNEGCTNNGERAITFYGDYFINLTDIKYIMTHELGHRFTDTSGSVGMSVAIC